MADMMTFPNTVEEFMEQYKIVDTEKIYTNGADLVPIFRMMQWFEHISATDTISRQAALDIFDDYNVAVENGQIEAYSRDRKRLCNLPPVTPKQRTGRWERHYSRPNVYADLFWHCSECGYKNNDDYAPTYHKFCPNCGIKMIQTDKTCDCYSDGRCVGTKEIDLCSCGGNKSKCDFYENVRREGGAE